MSTNDPNVPRPVTMENVSVHMSSIDGGGTAVPATTEGGRLVMDPTISNFVELTVGSRRYEIEANAYPHIGTHLTQIRYKNEANGLNTETGVEPEVALVLLRQAQAIATNPSVSPAVISQFQYSMGDALDDGELNNSIPRGPRSNVPPRR